jgi:hypothetical protein
MTTWSLCQLVPAKCLKLNVKRKEKCNLVRENLALQCLILYAVTFPMACSFACRVQRELMKGLGTGAHHTAALPLSDPGY